jgi:hypothetical protein
MKNELVKIKAEYLSQSEINCGALEEVFEVVEDNGDRLFIEPRDCDMPIRPRELVRRNMLITIEEK